MKASFWSVCLLLGLVLAATGCAKEHLLRAPVGALQDGRMVVPTTQIVDSAGETVSFSGRPVDMAISPDGTLLAVKNMRGITFVDVGARKVHQNLDFKNDSGSFGGIAWSGDGQGVWVTTASSTLCRAERQADGRFVWDKKEVRLPGPQKGDASYPGGFVLDPQGHMAYVALSRNNTVGVVNLETRTLEQEIPVGIAPYGVTLAGGKAYVSNWGGRRPVAGDATGPTSGSEAVVDPATGVASTGTVSVLDLAARTVTAEIVVGLHPCGMGLAPDGRRVYVTNAHSDTVSVIDTASDTVAATLSTKPTDEIPFGSTPNAVAVSPDGKRLYVANGGNNAVAVFDLPEHSLKGFIPSGWYPGAVTVSSDGTTLYIANTKGMGSRYLDEKEAGKASPAGYNARSFLGSVSLVPTPSTKDLDALTLRVAANMRLPQMHKSLHVKSVPERTVPVPTRPGEVSVFKHVLYIIKENRTYDQVFGDMPQGNGEPSLCQFGREVTPNHHALAEEFVLLDNLYCNGAVSADGHQWTDEGYASDYLEKSFGRFTRSYPYDGGDALAYAPTGFIWDYVLRKGLTFRDYGEFVGAEITPAKASWQTIYDALRGKGEPVTIRGKAKLNTLEPYICPTYIGFPSTVQDAYRADEFIKELKAFEAKGEWPNFIIMLLPNDHTSGTKPGMPTPNAMVADNDLALGRIVEAVSHSRFWPETAIFVVEDDPQAGVDHVDGHRTIAQCISPYTRRGVVDSTHYNQTSILRTMELILGLPPMNQFDLAANPMTRCFTDKADLTPYTARPNTVPLDQMNPNLASLKGRALYYARKSMELPLDDVDQADEDTFNRILWHATKGYDTPYPKQYAAVVPKQD